MRCFPITSSEKKRHHCRFNLVKEAVGKVGRHKRNRGSGRSVVEGFVKGSTSRPVNTGSIGAGSVNLWLRTHPLLKNLFDTGLQPEPLPRLHEHWSVLGDKSLSEAIGYMEQQQRAFKDVAILGVTVPGQLCVVALPLAFIASFGYLYLHLRMAVVTSPGVAASFPWIGIYDDWLAAIVTSLSLTWVPFLLMVGDCPPLLVSARHAVGDFECNP